MVYSCDETPLIPLPVLSKQWHSEDSDENFYDVPRNARHLRESEVRNHQKIVRRQSSRVSFDCVLGKEVCGMVSETECLFQALTTLAGTT